MVQRVVFRSMLTLAAVAGLTGFSSSVRAIIVGDPNGSPPDSPANHVDPNVTTSRYGGVGSLVSSDQGFIGTAMLIDSTHILTAAHVAQKDADPTKYTFNLNYSGAYSSQIPVTAAAVSSVFTASGSVGGGHGDIAVLTLASPVPTGVPIYPLYTGSSLHSVLTLVGYGYTGDGVSGGTIGNGSPDVKRWGKNTFDQFGTFPDIYQFDFDGPTSATNYTGGLTLGNAIEATIYYGDSGGPAFVDVNGQLMLAGVNTGMFPWVNGPAAPLFGSGANGTLVQPYTSWIEGIATGATSVPEPATFGLIAGGLALACLRRRPRA